MENRDYIFVTGITGNQGGAVAKHLLEQNKSVIGLTRNARSERANYWKEKGVTIIEGVMENSMAFQSYLDKASTIFLVQALQGKDKEIQQGKKFIDAIKQKEDTHLVYSSALGADLNTGVPHIDSKFEIENYIKSKSLNATILRPASFYENHLFPQVSNAIMKGKYITPLIKTCKLQMIGVENIGKIATTVMNNKEKYKHKTITIASDEMQVGNIPQLFSAAISKQVKYKKLPGIITRLAMGKDLSIMYKYMNKNDFRVIDNISEVRDEFNISGDFRSWINENFKPKAND